MNLLEVVELTMHFPLRRGIFSRAVGSIRAVDGISFAIAPGKTLGLVGESGCGKSTAARAILQLTRPSSGKVLFEGTDLCQLEPEPLRRLRRHFQMVFQDPYSSLNPRMNVGEILAEPFLVHHLVPKKEIDSRVDELLQKVGLNPESKLRFPHEFSGGQRQRIAIARALASSPKLVVCDEPVSSLDVSVRAQIVNLLDDLQQSMGMAYLFISHELAIVRHLAHDVAVMYLGKIVELGPKERLFSAPLHPYTKMLLESGLDPVGRKGHAVLPTTSFGEVPSPENPPSGCAFHPRCPLAEEICRKEVPRLRPHGPGHESACHLV